MRSHPTNGPYEIDVPAALTPTTTRALREAVERADDGPGTTAVLRGGAEGFCRGMEVASLGNVEETRLAVEDFVGTLLAIRRAHRIFIAAVEGPAYGGGVGLAAACDVVVASEDASFGLPEVLFGLAPVTVWPVLRERISSQGVRRMALAGFAHTAARALELGLVDEVVDPGELDAAVARWSWGMRHGEQAGIGALKRLSADQEGLEAALREGASHLEELLAGSDATARVRAYQNGGAPWSTP